MERKGKIMWNKKNPHLEYAIALLRRQGSRRPSKGERADPAEKKVAGDELKAGIL